MSQLGKVMWFDLTVPDAEKIRDFYRDVIGWTTSNAKMGEYDDYCMHPPGGDPVAGVCHTRGVNADLPAQWLMYVNIANMNDSIAKCKAAGGTVISGPRTFGQFGTMTVIRDPAGAYLTLVEPLPTKALFVPPS